MVDADAAADAPAAKPESGRPPSEAAPEVSAARPVRRNGWVKLVAGIAVLATGWHLVASFLWIAPPSPLREIVPGNALTSYMIPFFGQSWSVFAPEPINGDYRFEVRAITASDGAETGSGSSDGAATGTEADASASPTEWVSATDVELSMIRDNLFPPRAGIQSSELASGYKSAYDELDPEQQTSVAGDYLALSWESELRAALVDAGADGGASAGDDAEPDEYLAMDHRATAYATQVAHALWGDDVSRVQYRVSRQNVVPFEQRNDASAERPAVQTTNSGWRAPLVELGQNEENFARTFRAQYDRMRHE